MAFSRAAFTASSSVLPMAVSRWKRYTSGCKGPPARCRCAIALRGLQQAAPDVDDHVVGAGQVLLRAVGDRAPLVLDHGDVLQRERLDAGVGEVLLGHAVDRCSRSAGWPWASRCRGSAPGGVAAVLVLVELVAAVMGS